MQSSWVSREGSWSSAQPTEPPSRAMPRTGSRVAAGLHTGVCRFQWQQHQGRAMLCSRLLRVMPSTAAATSPGPTGGYEEQSFLLAGASSCSTSHYSKTALYLLRAPVVCGVDMALQSQHRKCLLLEEAQSQDGVWVLADPRDMALPLPGGMCGYSHRQEEGSKVIAVMNTVALEGRGCSIDSASPVPAASERALLVPAGLVCLSPCHSSSGAALAAGCCQPCTFTSNGAGPPAHPPCVQRCLAVGHEQRDSMLLLVLLCCRQVWVSLPPPSPGSGTPAVQICCPCNPQHGCVYQGCLPARQSRSWERTDETAAPS